MADSMSFPFLILQTLNHWRLLPDSAKLNARKADLSTLTPKDASFILDILWDTLQTKNVVGTPKDRQPLEITDVVYRHKGLSHLYSALVMLAETHTQYELSCQKMPVPEPANHIHDLDRDQKNALTDHAHARLFDEIRAGDDTPDVKLVATALEYAIAKHLDNIRSQGRFTAM